MTPTKTNSSWTGIGIRKIEDMDYGNYPEFVGRILEKIEYRRNSGSPDYPDEYWFTFGNNLDAITHTHCLPEAKQFDLKGNQRFIGLRVANAQKHEIDGRPAFTFVFEGGHTMNFVSAQVSVKSEAKS